ncbi:MAG: zinc ABC transporter substrate-binding protein [Myxococcales bacterium]|nr:zinc ABC transporter substrate-binding protein [Myxococcales bacterium]
MKRFIQGVALALLVATPATAQAKLDVVATLPDLAAIAKAVGGDDVRVTALAAPSEDPHFVDARPSLMLPLSRADLLVVDGLGLEIGWLPTLLVGARNKKIQVGAAGYLDASSSVRKLEVPTTKIDRSMGDLHPGGNPHFTYDPRAGAAIAKAIGARMAQLDPDHADAYVKRAGAYAATLEAFAASERARFDKLPAAKRNFVAYHESLNYLADWLGLTQIGTVESKPGVSPDPAHAAEILRTMKAKGAKVIIQEEFYPRHMSQTLTKMLDGKVAVIHGGTRFDDGQSYLEHLKNVADTVYDALE